MASSGPVTARCCQTKSVPSHHPCTSGCGGISDKSITASSRLEELKSSPGTAYSCGRATIELGTKQLDLNLSGFPIGDYRRYWFDFHLPIACSAFHWNQTLLREKFKRSSLGARWVCILQRLSLTCGDLRADLLETAGRGISPPANPCLPGPATHPPRLPPTSPSLQSNDASASASASASPPTSTETTRQTRLPQDPLQGSSAEVLPGEEGLDRAG